MAGRQPKAGTTGIQCKKPVSRPIHPSTNHRPGRTPRPAYNTDYILVSGNTFRHPFAPAASLTPEG